MYILSSTYPEIIDVTYKAKEMQITCPHQGDYRSMHQAWVLERFGYNYKLTNYSVYSPDKLFNLSVLHFSPIGFL